MSSDRKLRILVADKLTDEGVEILRNGGEFEVVNDPEITPEKLAETLGEYDALAIRSRSRVTREALANAGRLRVVGRAGVGLDNVDIEAATERGVIVMNTPDGNTLSTAEHTVSMMLSLARKIPRADREMKAGGWPKKSLTGMELAGKTLGVIGMGKIGREVAHRMRAFGMNILVYDPFLNETAADKLGVRLADVDEICREADLVTVHTPLNKDTRGIVDARRLATMKPTALVVNCARGGIIDEAALLEALQAGRIGGAALDVFEEEPLPRDHPFRALENVVLTPHLAASTVEAQDKVTKDVAEQIVEVLKGGVIRNAVNAPSLDPRELEAMAPALSLCERLGRFAAQYCPTPATRIEVQCSGTAADYDARALATAVVKGFLAPMGEATVNYVNARHLAKGRDMEVVESRSSDAGDYRGLINVLVESADGTRSSIAGTLFHGKFPRIVTIDGKRLTALIEGRMIVIHNRDLPGIVGSVGTALGDHGINIADMSWGRTAAGGEATTVINVDQEVTPQVLEVLRGVPNVLSVRTIDLT